MAPFSPNHADGRFGARVKTAQNGQKTPHPTQNVQKPSWTRPNVPSCVLDGCTMSLKTLFLLPSIHPSSPPSMQPSIQRGNTLLIEQQRRQLPTPQRNNLLSGPNRREPPTAAGKQPPKQENQPAALYDGRQPPPARTVVTAGTYGGGLQPPKLGATPAV